MNDSEKLDLILGQMGTVNERLGGIDKRLEGMDERFEAVDKRLDGMDKRLDGMDKRLDGMDKRLDVMDRRFDEVDEKLKVVDKRLDRLEESDKALDVRLDVFAEKLGDYGRKLSETKVFMENVVLHDIHLLAENHTSLMEKAKQAVLVSERTNLHELQMSDLITRVGKLETEIWEVRQKLAS